MHVAKTDWNTYFQVENINSVLWGSDGSIPHLAQLSLSTLYIIQYSKIQKLKKVFWRLDLSMPSDKKRLGGTYRMHLLHRVGCVYHGHLCRCLFTGGWKHRYSKRWKILLLFNMHKKSNNIQFLKVCTMLCNLNICCRTHEMFQCLH